MAANRRNLLLTKPQAVALRELITDDLDETDLSPDERQQFTAVLHRLDGLLADWPWEREYR